MKTLVLLSALALLAFLAQAEPLPEASVEAKSEEKQGVEDQDVSITFGDPEGSVLQDAALRKNPFCKCKWSRCKHPEVFKGYCDFNLKKSVCCI